MTDAIPTRQCSFLNVRPRFPMTDDRRSMSIVDVRSRCQRQLPAPLISASLPATLLSLSTTLLLLPPLCGYPIATKYAGFRALFSALAVATFLVSCLAFVFAVGLWGSAAARFEEAGMGVRFGPLVSTCRRRRRRLLYSGKGEGMQCSFLSFLAYFVAWKRVSRIHYCLRNRRTERISSSPQPWFPSERVLFL